MYCKKCGKEVPAGVRFCTGCGAPVDSEAGEKRGAAKGTNLKVPLWAVVAVLVVLVAIFGLRSCSKGEPASDSSVGAATAEASATPEPTPTPDPAEALVGTWGNKDGIGLKFTSDGKLKLSGLGLELEIDTFTYEVTDENTLTLTATVGGIVSKSFTAPYGIWDDILYIDILDYSFELKKQ